MLSGEIDLAEQVLHDRLEEPAKRVPAAVDPCHGRARPRPGGCRAGRARRRDLLHLDRAEELFRATLGMPFERARTRARSWPGPSAGGAAPEGPRGHRGRPRDLSGARRGGLDSTSRPGAGAARGRAAPRGRPSRPLSWQSPSWRPRVARTGRSRRSWLCPSGPSRASCRPRIGSSISNLAASWPRPWPLPEARPPRSPRGLQSSVVPRMRPMDLPPTVQGWPTQSGASSWSSGTSRRSAPARWNRPRSAWPKRQTTRPAT